MEQPNENLVIKPQSFEAQAAFYLVATALVNWVREAQSQANESADSSTDDMGRQGIFCIVCQGELEAPPTKENPDPNTQHLEDCPYQLALTTLHAYDLEEPGPTGIRRRLNQAVSVKGIVTPNFTVETEGGTQEDFESHYERMHSFVSENYPLAEESLGGKSAD